MADNGLGLLEPFDPLLAAAAKWDTFSSVGDPDEDGHVDISPIRSPPQPHKDLSPPLTGKD